MVPQPGQFQQPNLMAQQKQMVSNMQNHTNLMKQLQMAGIDPTLFPELFNFQQQQQQNNGKLVGAQPQPQAQPQQPTN